MRLLVTDRPYIIGHRGEIGLGELGAAHGGHHAGVLLGFWYAVGDRPGNRLEAAIAPEPLAARQIGTHARALAVRTVASRACPPGGLSFKNALAQGDLVRRCARRYREWTRTGVRMDAFRRQSVAGCRRLRGRR